MNNQILAEINRLERVILVHSYIYYEKNSNVISDSQFDKICVKLVKLMNNYQEEFKVSQYYYDFKYFDGSTGCDLPYRLPEIVNIGEWLLKHNGGNF